MVEGRPDQAHRPGHVRENVIPKKPDGAGVAASSGVGDAHFVIIVMLDPAGNVAAAGWTVGVDATVAWLDNHAPVDAILFVDAPLVVNNETGQRRCEKQVGQLY